MMMTKEQIKQREKEAREQYAEIKREAEKQAKHYNRQNQIVGEYLREKHADAYRDYISRPDFYDYIKSDHERVMFNLPPKDPEYNTKQEIRNQKLLESRRKSLAKAEKKLEDEKKKPT